VSRRQSNVLDNQTKHLSAAWINWNNRSNTSSACTVFASVLGGFGGSAEPDVRAGSSINLTIILADLPQKRSIAKIY
jgi:hypothetical protein